MKNWEHFTKIRSCADFQVSWHVFSPSCGRPGWIGQLWISGKFHTYEKIDRISPVQQGSKNSPGCRLNIKLIFFSEKNGPKPTYLIQFSNGVVKIATILSSFTTIFSIGKINKLKSALQMCPDFECLILDPSLYTGGLKHSNSDPIRKLNIFKIDIGMVRFWNSSVLEWSGLELQIFGQSSEHVWLGCYV